MRTTNRGDEATIVQPKSGFASIDDIRIAMNLGSNAAVYRAIRNGRLPHFRIGRLVRVRWEALEQFMTQQEAQTAA